MLLKPLIWTITKWAKNQEKEILSLGEPLSTKLIGYAKKLGIKYPEKIRILYVPKVCLCEWNVLRNFAQKQGLDLNKIKGIAFGYGIKIRKDQKNDLKLIIHEMIHVRQYEQLGFDQFIAQYVTECVQDGYYGGSLEKEARMGCNEREMANLKGI